MSNICIIPARGGSKRIPRKNIKFFLDKPIIAFSIEAAINSQLFEKIIVSTEDPEIAEIAIKYGAEVPFMRSKNNSDDFATTFDVLEEVLKKYKSLGKEFTNICCLYACAPFVTQHSLKEAYTKLIEADYDTVFPVIPFGFPIQRALRVDQENLKMLDEKHLNTRSQDLEELYHDAGQFYWANTERLLHSKKILSQNTGGIIITEMDAQDIDTEIDWKLAELKYKLTK